VIHPVDDIADAIVSILLDETIAGDRVYRDREPDLHAKTELPAIVVHVAEDDPVDQQVQGIWRSEVRINVDLFTTAREEDISRSLLSMRAETYRLLMTDTNLGLPSVLTIRPGGAEDVQRGESAFPIGYLRTAFFVLYQHSFNDPTE
jgi:hypothetical protein